MHDTIIVKVSTLYYYIDTYIAIIIQCYFYILH